MMRTARPGPGKGWRHTISSGRPSSSPTARTSSLNSGRSGSTSVEGHVLGQPAHVVVRLDGRRRRAVPDSMTSGYSVPCTRKRASFDVGGHLFEDADEGLADGLALGLGIGDPSSTPKNRSAALTWIRSMWNWRRKVSSTWSASPVRMRPVSTKTQVSWSPMARCTRAAATAESTPPDSAHSTRAVADLGPHRLQRRLDDVGVGPQRAGPAHVEEEALEELLAPVGVDHLGVELHAVDVALGVGQGRHRAPRAWTRWPRSRRAPP